jgi:plasmid stability protein
MRRTLVQFDEETYRKLRQRAFRQERSIASVVRELVANGLDRPAARARPNEVSQFSSVRAGRSRQGRLAPISEKHDKALATAFET